MPLAAFIYFLCYLDRSNIGNAKVLNTSTKNDMQSETGMSNYEFNLALMIFLIGCELGTFSCSFFSCCPLRLLYHLCFKLLTRSTFKDFLFEVPSNILLKKLRPSRWLAFLMVSAQLTVVSWPYLYNRADTDVA